MHTIWGKRQRGIGQRGPGHEGLLVEHGIDENRIYPEAQSRDTVENIRNSKEIMDSKGLPKDMILVSDGFHQYRAGLIAQKQGIEAGAFRPKLPGIPLQPTGCGKFFALAQEISFPLMWKFNRNPS